MVSPNTKHRLSVKAIRSCGRCGWCAWVYLWVFAHGTLKINPIFIPCYYTMQKLQNTHETNTVSLTTNFDNRRRDSKKKGQRLWCAFPGDAGTFTFTFLPLILSILRTSTWEFSTFRSLRLQFQRPLTDQPDSVDLCSARRCPQGAFDVEDKSIMRRKLGIQSNGKTGKNCSITGATQPPRRVPSVLLGADWQSVRGRHAGKTHHLERSIGHRVVRPTFEAISLIICGGFDTENASRDGGQFAATSLGTERSETTQKETGNRIRSKWWQTKEGTCCEKIELIIITTSSQVLSHNLREVSITRRHPEDSWNIHAKLYEVSNSSHKNSMPA